MEPSVDSDQCYGCGECVNINPKMFGWNENKQIKLLDYKTEKYTDIVTAAERCPARCIKPGDPWNPNEENLNRLKNRADKFNKI